MTKRSPGVWENEDLGTCGWDVCLRPKYVFKVCQVRAGWLTPGLSLKGEPFCGQVNGQNLTPLQCPDGGRGVAGKRSGPALQGSHPNSLVRVHPEQGEAGVKGEGTWGQAGVWGPGGVSGPVSERAEVLSHADLSTGRGSGRRVGGAGH